MDGLLYNVSSLFSLTCASSNPLTLMSKHIGRGACILI